MNSQELQTKGFCVVRGVVTEDACFDAVEKLWKFYEDISNGLVTRFDSKSWNNETIYPKGGLFENFGAGWMLGSLREVLADKLFQELYSTKELHCSKEGFRIVCMPPNSTTCFQASNEQGYRCFSQSPTYVVKLAGLRLHASVSVQFRFETSPLKED